MMLGLGIQKAMELEGDPMNKTKIILIEHKLSSVQVFSLYISIEIIYYPNAKDLKTLFSSIIVFTYDDPRELPIYTR